MIGMMWMKMMTIFRFKAQGARTEIGRFADDFRAGHGMHHVPSQPFLLPSTLTRPITSKYGKAGNTYQ